ncbi:26S proteasome non-ATPase regulatory subunit [Nowakowskiella sp. JEL0407]|nr:26S proteasome non-ATPase regulatory subunit [Nowakowskiella sp. JEL0407]
MVETRSTKEKKPEQADVKKETEAPKDVEMELDDADKEAKKQAEEKALFLADIKQNVLLLERAVSALETRFNTRVLRMTASIRRRFTNSLLSDAICAHFPKESAVKTSLLGYLGKSDSQAMNVDQVEKETLPEVEVYFGLVVLLFLHDSKAYEKGVTLATELVNKVQSLNRRTLDQLAARVYFYCARFYELLNRAPETRPLLLAAHRTAALRHDDETQATVLNLLLRNYLQYNLFDQADKLVSKTTFPEAAPNNQVARHFYYLGRIKATQLEYTEAHMCLLQAQRKTPQTNATAGFQQAVNKLAIIVQLLMGEIPERSIFRERMLRLALVPYLHLTQAVRVGDLAKFQETLASYESTFKADKTYTLILRLRHNVIRTGLRMISLSYTRISLRDICLKLLLDSEEDAEYIVSKAIRDGVIDAVIDHEKGFMKSKEIADVYSTTEPQNAFHRRIDTCLKLHNESVKALRFPNGKGGGIEEGLKEIIEEERKLAKEIVEGELDDEDDMEF